MIMLRNSLGVCLGCRGIVRGAIMASNPLDIAPKIIEAHGQSSRLLAGELGGRKCWLARAVAGV